MSDITAIDGACRILGTDKVQVYLLAGLSVASIVAHANSVAMAKMDAEALSRSRAQDALDAGPPLRRMNFPSLKQVMRG